MPFMIVHECPADEFAQTSELVPVVLSKDVMGPLGKNPAQKVSFASPLPPPID